jgi:triacylglycerol lipase
MNAIAIPKLRSPIVLVHGLFGFDRLQVRGWTIASYFSKIPETLAAAGNRVLVAALSPTGGVAERAGQLKAFLDREASDEPVHLFAHSMGGLDSRYLISRLDMAGRVLTLTSIGTPHRGTVFADWGIRRFERFVRPVVDLLGIPRQAFYDLTTERCREFNEQTPDAPGVRYFSVAGRYEGRWGNPAWLVSAPIVGRAEGPNDGLVSVASATWGEETAVWAGDHLNLVNWPNRRMRRAGAWRDRAADYGRLLERLAEVEGRG